MTDSDKPDNPSARISLEGISNLAPEAQQLAVREMTSILRTQSRSKCCDRLCGDHRYVSVLQHVRVPLRMVLSHD